MNDTIEKLVRAALEKVRQNIIDHVFLEIQRGVNRKDKLFRDYVRLLGNGGEAKYGKVNCQIAQRVKNAVGGKMKVRVMPDCEVIPMSMLIQSFKCFDPNTVEVKAGKSKGGK